MAKVNLGRVVGRSAYEEAVRLGFEGTEAEWLETLNGKDGIDGKTAYESAQSAGFEGTEEEFNSQLSSIGNINAVLDLINGEVV